MLPLLWCVQGSAQSVTFSLPDTIVGVNGKVRIPIRVKDFDDVVSIQFSMNWNRAIISYESFEQGDLENVAIGNSQASNGVIRLSWFDPDGVGQSMPDGSVLVYLNFMARGPEGSSTPIEFRNTPLPIQVFRAGVVPGVFLPLVLNAEDGNVTIQTPELSVATDVKDISCFGASDGAINISIAANQDYTVNWTGPDFTSTQPNISNLAPGDYDLTLRSPGGEVLYETTLTVDEPEELQIEQIRTTAATCGSGRGSASVDVVGGSTPYTYDLGDGPMDARVLESLAPGSYTLVLTDANGCSDSGTFTIDNTGAPTVDLGEDRSICPEETVELSVGAFSSYRWSTGAQTSSIVVFQTGKYSITVTDANGCEASDEVLINSGGNVQLLIENDFLEICPGDSIELMISGADTYTWRDTSGTLSALDIPNPKAAPGLTSGYRVIGETKCGVDSVDLEVFVLESPAMVGPDTCVAPGEEAQLLASGGISYFWEKTPFPVSDPNTATPTVIPDDSGTYVVAITDFQGCVIRDSMQVLVALDPNGVIRAMNVITPNGDNRNDVLYFPNIDKFGQNSLKVFNRWGNIVYQKVNYQRDEDRFDGTYQGEPLPPGTYYYLLSFRSGELKQKLTILR
jgi:gliding motility-associated-like protein